MKLSEMDRCLDNLDIQPILNSKVHRVKWLYNNSNKMTFVYEEKLVRLIVHRLEQKIKHLESDNKYLKERDDTAYERITEIQRKY